MVYYCKALRMMKDKGVNNNTPQDDANRGTKQTKKTANYRRLSGIELAAEREGLSFDIRRSNQNNS